MPQQYENARIYSRTRVHRAVTSPVCCVSWNVGRTAPVANCGSCPRLSSNPVTFGHQEEPHVPQPIQPPFALRRRLWRAGDHRLRLAPSRAAEDAVIIPPPAADVPASDGIQTAVVAGGCFWGVQGVFQHTAGVVNAVSGYAGGSKSTADYNMVSTGTTGHAESVQIKYDPKKISYGKILQIFFSVAHDPTQLNRQGPDSGTQYRSAIFTTSDEQKKVADAYIAQLNAAKVYKKPIVTKVGPLEGVLSGGSLSSGLPDAAPEPALYCL